MVFWVDNWNIYNDEWCPIAIKRFTNYEDKTHQPNSLKAETTTLATITKTTTTITKTKILIMFIFFVPASSTGGWTRWTTTAAGSWTTWRWSWWRRIISWSLWHQNLSPSTLTPSGPRLTTAAARRTWPSRFHFKTKKVLFQKTVKYASSSSNMIKNIIISFLIWCRSHKRNIKQVLKCLKNL